MVTKSQKWLQYQLIQIFLRIFLASICVVHLTRNYLKASTLEGIFFQPQWSSWFHFPCLFLIVCCSSRNKRKYSNNDEPSDSLKAMDGIKVVNGLECKISCKTSKVCNLVSAGHSISGFIVVENKAYLAMPWMQVSYVLDTEDFLFRLRKRRKILRGGNVPDSSQISKIYAAKVQRFNRFLSKP